MSAAILTRLSQSYRARKLMERQLFHDSNRREVLALYREVLKAVDHTIPRKLEKEAKLAVSLSSLDCFNAYSSPSFILCL